MSLLDGDLLDASGCFSCGGSGYVDHYDGMLPHLMLECFFCVAVAYFRHSIEIRICRVLESADIAPELLPNCSHFHTVIQNINCLLQILNLGIYRTEIALKLLSNCSHFHFQLSADIVLTLEFSILRFTALELL